MCDVTATASTCAEPTRSSVGTGTPFFVYFNHSLIDTMTRKARAGHVTGGRCFGYRNVDVLGPGGKRSHVERVIEPDEACVIRRVFDLAIDGYGMKAIAKTLNAAGARSPRAQCGRPQSWAPSSVWAVLHRDAYRGELVYAQTQKRDKWGRKHQAPRPESDWIRVAAPALAIVTPDVWSAAHARIDAARALYMTSTNGQAFGRPALGNPSKYLLTNLATCPACAGPLSLQTRHHGHAESRQRKRFYGCAGHRDRGTCANGRVLPMDAADAIVVEALLEDIIDESIVRDAVDVALEILRGDDGGAEHQRLDGELAGLDREHAALMAAVKRGDRLQGLYEALSALDARRRDTEARRSAIASRRGLSARDCRHLRDELLELAADWRRVLVDDPTNARPIVSSLLAGRVTFTALDERNRWRVDGEGTFAGLFSRVFATTAVGDSSPTGFEPVFWP